METKSFWIFAIEYVFESRSEENVDILSEGNRNLIKKLNGNQDTSILFDGFEPNDSILSPH